MNKLISVAAFLVVASTPGLAADVEPKAAVDFVLSTCLPAMDDLANVDKIAQERGWLRLPDLLPLNPEIEKSRAQWQAPGFYVLTHHLLIRGMEHKCFVTFGPAKVERDEFYQAISAVLELMPKSDSTFPQSGWRHESYEIIGQKPQQLSITSRGGAMLSSSISGGLP
jgi:hypothetical protein